MRRRDRAVEDPAWIRDFLARAAVGTVAVCDGPQPLLVPNLFLFDPERGAVYVHSARLGTTRSVAEANDRVAFAVHEMGRLLPADEALEFSTEFASVVAVGRATIVEDPDEAREALQALLDKYAPHLSPGRDYRPPTPEEMTRTTVLRIDVESWSGKRKAAEPDFPGAYTWPPP
jgi:nitroimidazol reductase NimA-like FMN-containing flavoprotein (pyridoxamine 5'-phosphate oxidase superfamily)